MIRPAYAPETSWVARALSAALLAVAIGACGAPGDADLETSTQDAIITPIQWRWESPVIPVCWVDPLPQHAWQRSIVQTKIMQTWGKQSGVLFSGWQACVPGSSAGISIGVEDGRSWSFVGTKSRLHYPSMKLNFSYISYSPICAPSLQFCVGATAVHEFGHALGFYHEQDRVDTPAACIESLKDDALAISSQSSDGMAIGAWDESSVMNYCNPTWVNSGELSSGDVAAIQYMFGAPAPQCLKPKPVRSCHSQAQVYCNLPAPRCDYKKCVSTPEGATNAKRVCRQNGGVPRVDGKP